MHLLTTFSFFQEVYRVSKYEAYRDCTKCGCPSYATLRSGVYQWVYCVKCMAVLEVL